MLSLVVALIFFLLSVVAHIVVYRLFSNYITPEVQLTEVQLKETSGVERENPPEVKSKKPRELEYKKKLPYQGFFIFPLVAIINFFATSLPFSSTLLYILLSIIYLVYFINASSGEDSPSGRIYMMVKKKGPMTGKQIEREFSASQLIGKRLNSLTSANLLVKEGVVYKASPKGRLLVEAISLYKRVLKLDEEPDRSKSNPRGLTQRNLGG